jgi:LL-diaminopimelate aminotransferase
MKIETAKRLEGIGEYYFSKKLREIDEMNKEGERVINLGIGSPDMPPADEVVDTLSDESHKPNVHGYQNYKGIPALRTAISEWYQKWYNVTLDANTEILPLIGSKEGIMHISMTYLNDGDEVLIPNPGYPTYSSATKLAGGKPVYYKLKEDNDWQPDFGSIEKTDLSKIKLMWVNYPHMPTGQAPTKELFQRLVKFGQEHNILICHDNPYSFILNEHPLSLLSISGAKDVVVELNSLSKSHNMAGWRIGMICAGKQRIEEILRFKSNMDSGMFLPLQKAAEKALGATKDWHHQLNEMYKRRRDFVLQILDLLNCSYNKEQVGLFIWARVPSNIKDGFELSDSVLTKSRVFITPGGIFGSEGNNYIRISLCSTEDQLAEAIKRIQAS